jgi:ribosomal protein S18 acetylase RimI-like enzyme
MNDYRFELALARDAGAIASLSHRLIETGLAPTWSADRVLCHIKRVDSVVLAGRCGDVLAGFAIMQFGDAHAHLNLLAVDNAHQRRGLGRQLMTWLHESAMVAGTFRLGLELRAANTAALRFYESLGYRRGSLLRGYYQGVEDALQMSCDLTVGRDATV